MGGPARAAAAPEEALAVNVEMPTSTSELLLESVYKSEDFADG